MGRPRKYPLPPSAEEEIQIEVTETVKEVVVEKPKHVEKVSIDGPGVKCEPVEPGSKAARQLEYYATQPKVTTRLIRREGEKPGAFETVIVNGLRINILKGVSVRIPQDVSDIIDDAFYKTDQAISNTQVTDPFSGTSKPLAVDQQDNKERY